MNKVMNKSRDNLRVSRGELTLFKKKVIYPRKKPCKKVDLLKNYYYLNNIIYKIYIDIINDNIEYINIYKLLIK